MSDSNFRGTLLTRQWRDTPSGIELTFWVATPSGPIQCVIPNQRAVCFVPQEQVEFARQYATAITPLDLQTLTGGEPVSAVYFNHQRALIEFRDLCRNAKVTVCESDVKPADRFLMERFVRCGVGVTGNVVNKTGYRQIINPKFRPDDYIGQLRSVSLDIETDTNSEQVISIACSWQDNGVRQSRVFILKHLTWSSLPVAIDRQKLSIHDSEVRLLSEFLSWFLAFDPDVIIGWNLIGFDLAYLQKRFAVRNLAFSMGRGGAHAAILPPGSRAQIFTASIPGRIAIDGIEMLRAAFWNFESFALESVAQSLFGEGKLIDETVDKTAEIRRLHAHEPVKLIAYNVRDCELVEDIFEHTNLIAFVLQRSQLTGLALGRIGGSVAAFDNLYLPALHRRGFVAGDVADVKIELSSPGGFVLDSVPGLYRNVIVLDFKSLYPSIIRSFLIDPMGLAVKGDDQVPGFHGASFSRDQPILPELIAGLWSARDEAKRESNAALSQAIKIIMNSFYGVLGASGCRFHHHQLASSITRRGHEIIQKTREWIEQVGYSVIYGDTDSVFVLFGDEFTPEQTRDLGNRLVDVLNERWRKTLFDEYRIESFLELEFETLFTRFLMPTVRGDIKGSKKRYAGLLGENQMQEIVFKGMESVRTDWTPLARQFQRELYRRVFHDEPYQEFIRDTVRELQDGARDEELKYRKRLRKPLETYTKNVPPHVQAARKLPRAGRWISYFVTVNGPEPEGFVESQLDYEHYIERQLAPAANSLLTCLDTDFEQITGAQISMF
ncbi:MAG: DNA polymerase II [Pseudomonadota bacterium]